MGKFNSTLQIRYCNKKDNYLNFNHLIKKKEFGHDFRFTNLCVIIYRFRVIFYTFRFNNVIMHG